MTEIGLGGAWLLGQNGERSLEAGAQIVHHAIEQGINLIDTAECYGESEKAIGLALDGTRYDGILATKFGHVPSGFDFSRTSVLDSVRRSQERLRNRPIDLLQLHTPDEPDWDRIVGPNGAIEGMREARESGWCRFVGITGRDIPFLRRCLDLGFFDTMLMFLRYDLIDQSGERLIAEAAAQDVGVMLGSPLRMGLLGAPQSPRMDSEAEQAHLDALYKLFEHEPGGVRAAAMRFALGHPGGSSVLSGAGSIPELDEILAIDRAPLSAELDGQVRELSARYLQESEQ